MHASRVKTAIRYTQVVYFTVLDNCANYETPVTGQSYFSSKLI